MTLPVPGFAQAGSAQAGSAQSIEGDTNMHESSDEDPGVEEGGHRKEAPEIEGE